jgi:hypothetical protein
MVSYYSSFIFKELSIVPCGILDYYIAHKQVVKALFKKVNGPYNKANNQYENYKKMHIFCANNWTKLTLK